MHTLKGQATHYRFHNHTKNLAGAFINGIAQDSKGFIWASTSNAIGRYDGHEFRILGETNPNLSPLLKYEIECMAIDHHDVLWIGTLKGLWRYDIKTEDLQFYQHEADNPHSLSSSDITEIFMDNAGVLWVGTYDAGLNRLEKDGTFSHFRHTEKKIPTA